MCVPCLKNSNRDLFAKFHKYEYDFTKSEVTTPSG